MRSRKGRRCSAGSCTVGAGSEDFAAETWRTERSFGPTHFAPRVRAGYFAYKRRPAPVRPLLTAHVSAYVENGGARFAIRHPSE